MEATEGTERTEGTSSIWSRWTVESPHKECLIWCHHCGGEYLTASSLVTLVPALFRKHWQVVHDKPACSKCVVAAQPREEDPHAAARKMTREEIAAGRWATKLRSTSVPGLWAAEFTCELYPMPLGTMWFRLVGKGSIEIAHIYVLEWARRCGIATKLHEYVLERYPDAPSVRTPNGNDLSTPWLEKLGFQQDEDLGGEWVLLRKGAKA